MTVKGFYNKGYTYNERAPYFIDKENLTDEEWHRLTESKTFCMLPWMHMHAFPDGRVYPCCLADYWHNLGNLRKNTMKEVWNQAPYRTLRQNMMTETPSNGCKKCYEQEQNGAFSMRNDSNRNYGHLIKEVENTQLDGTHPEFKLRYWDVRFSNLCNFSCRSCGPIFSSNWYNDHVKLYNRKPDVSGREMARVVYFAGGEPLIMKEHYFMLEQLIKHGKTDVRIQYNTNFSELAFKDKHVFDYWKHFKNVSVGASLDGMGPQAELIRKGTDWKQTVNNRERMLTEVPHVDFYVSSTVCAMNVLHVLDFHKEWTKLGLVSAKDWNINICQSPTWYRIDILPEKFKQEVVVPAYEQHIEWLEPQDSLNRATTGYKSLVNLMTAKDASDKLPKFREEIAKLDQVRNENFWDTFPELIVLK